MSLVREHTEALGPPRALWVPFMLGRPLGAPDDPAFQKRVITAALALLERERGPVLEDFPDDAPDSPIEHDAEGAACPVSFSSVRNDATLGGKVAAEIDELRMWHALHERKHGRSAVGVTRRAPEQVAGFLCERVAGEPAKSLREDLSPAEALRLSCEELKAYYVEARMAQPGTHTAQALRDWFWGETAGGALLLALHTATENDSDDAVRDFSRNYLVPRAVKHTR